MGELDELKEVLKDTFSKIKDDITSNSKNVDKLSDDLNKLLKENKSFKKQMLELQNKILELKSTKPIVKKNVSSKAINDLVDDNVALKESLMKIETKMRLVSSSLNNDSSKNELDMVQIEGIIEGKINSLVNQKISVSDENQLNELTVKKLIDDKIKSIQPVKIDPKKQSLKEDVIRQFDKKRKDIIKHKILELITNNQMTLPEIKEIIVDQNNYCSKASFYRYIERMKLRQIIDFVELNGISLIVPFKPELRQK
jgi:hypothetical protein